MKMLKDVVNIYLMWSRCIDKSGISVFLSYFYIKR